MSTTYDFEHNCNGGCEHSTENCHHNDYDDKKHVHELIGSVIIERYDCDTHNHRFATVTGEAEKRKGCKTHVHRVEFTTDSYKDHTHDFCGYTGEAIDVGCGKHVHFINDKTEKENHHRHDFQAATLIENPTSHKK